MSTKFHRVYKYLSYLKKKIVRKKVEIKKIQRKRIEIFNFMRPMFFSVRKRVFMLGLLFSFCFAYMLLVVTHCISFIYFSYCRLWFSFLFPFIPIFSSIHWPNFTFVANFRLSHDIIPYATEYKTMNVCTFYYTSFYRTDSFEL